MNKLFTLEYFILALVIVLGFVVRLYKINNPIADWHSWRQADTSSVAKIFAAEGISFFYPRYYDISSIQTGIYNIKGYRMVEFPIFNAVHAKLAGIFNSLNFEVVGRLVSIASALISATALFLIGNKIIGKWGGLLSAFFYLFIPYNIYFTRVILPEPFAVTSALLGVYFFILFMEKEKNLLLFLSGILLSVAMLIKPFFIFYSVPLIYLVFRKYDLKGLTRSPKTIIKFLIFANIVLLPFFAWRIWINNFPQGIPHFEWAFNGDKIRFHPSFWRWIFAERLGHLILGVWGLIPFVFGILKAKTKNLFINYFLLGMFLYVSIVATASVRHDYYQIPVIPAVALTLSAGSLYLWKNSKLLLLFSLFIMFISGAAQAKEFYKINHPEIIEAGREVDRIAPQNARIIAPYNGDTAFLYQTGRFGWPVVDDSIDNMIKKGADYYVSVDIGNLDSKNFEKIFATIKKTDKYIILDLTKKLAK